MHFVRCLYIITAQVKSYIKSSVIALRFPSRSVILIEFRLPEAPIMLLSPKCREIFDLFRGQRECHSPQVITQSLLLPARGDGHHALVNTPSQCNLALADEILLRQRGQHLIARSRLGFGDSAQGAVCRNSNVLRLMILQERAMLQVVMKFNLVD